MAVGVQSGMGIGMASSHPIGCQHPLRAYLIDMSMGVHYVGVGGALQQQPRKGNCYHDVHSHGRQQHGTKKELYRLDEGRQQSVEAIITEICIGDRFVDDTAGASNVGPAISSTAHIDNTTVAAIESNIATMTNDMSNKSFMVHKEHLRYVYAYMYSRNLLVVLVRT